MDSSLPSGACAKGVLLGILGTLAVLRITPKVKALLSHRFGRNDNTSDDVPIDDPRPQILMDSADLSLRIFSKAEGVLRYRSDLLIVIERCVNDFNYSAILRTAEALGVQDVWLVDPPHTGTQENEMEDENVAKDQSTDLFDENAIHPSTEGTSMCSEESNKVYHNGKKAPKTVRTPQELEQRRLHHLFAQKATTWLSLREFPTSSDCLQALRKGGYTVWVTDLSQVAVPLTSECLPNELSTSTDKVALVFGTEAVGVSQVMLEGADLRVYLPLRGFADSLNLSVATALVIHQVLSLFPRFIGNYPHKDTLRAKWYTTLASQRMWTPQQKKLHRKLKALIADCESYQQKSSQGGSLTKEQLAKLGRISEHQAQLQSLEEEERRWCEDKVQAYIHNPPPPLTDLRRADEHRITFVGKNTKRKNEQHWTGMVATAYSVPTHGVTSRLFRSNPAK